LRSSVLIQGQFATEKLNDIRFDTQYAELNVSGQVLKNVKVVGDFYANALSGQLQVLDAYTAADITDTTHFSAGQILIPVDRANKAGPFFMIPWNYPGIFSVGGTVVPVTPKEGVFGRSTGGIVWGDVGDGLFKYYLGAFVPSLAESPLYSGRLSLALIGKETGFGQSATFYGGQDIVAIGLGGQYQKNGSVGPAPASGNAPRDDFAEVNGDVLAEFRLGGNGAFATAEADYYHYQGQYNLAKDQFSVLAAYATPTIGIGQIQPMVRYQYAKNGDQTEAAIDGQVAYLLRQMRLRLIADYQYTHLLNAPGSGADLTGNSLQFAVQAMFF
jgi:hypothetical protein